ncbi:MAG: phage portal protein [bacterium]
MSFWNKLFKTATQGVPFSFFMNSGMMSNVITRADALDFYKSWIYACVARRSMGLAQIDFKLYRNKKNGEVEEVIEHELLDLLYRINPEMTKYNFLQLSFIYRDLLGASPWILTKANESDKYPSNIYLARPEYFRVNRDDNGQVVNYVYEIGTYKRTFNKEEVIWLKNYNPRNPDKGIGVIEAVRQTAENDDYIVQSNSNLLKNNARPSGFLELEGNASKGMISRLKKEFKEKFQGYENSYHVQVLEAGMKFKPATIPPKDLDFIESRKMNRDEILSIFGVPKPILGVFEDVNRASAVAAEYAFNKWTLEPLATELIEQLNEFLVPMFGSDLWLDFSPLARADEEMDLKRKVEGWNKWLTTNEIRVDEGLQPVAGGDYIYMPLSNMPLIGGEKKEIIKIKAFSSSRVNLKKQEYVKKRVLNRNLKMKRLAEKATKKAMSSLFKNKRIILKIVNKNQRLTDEQKHKFYQERMLSESKLEGLWKSKMTSLFVEQEQRFINSIEKSDQVGVDFKSLSKTDEVTATIQVISPLMYETVMTGVAGASALIDQDVIMDMDFIKSWLDQVSEEIGTSITETTIADFEKTMNEGISAGESLSELKTRVEKVFDFAVDYRAELIARTETSRGVAEAHRQTYEHYGFTDVEWLLSPDACSTCQDRATQGWTVKDIAGQIPVHPNCKCDFTPL